MKTLYPPTHALATIHHHLVSEHTCELHVSQMHAVCTRVPAQPLSVKLFLDLSSLAAFAPAGRKLALSEQDWAVGALAMSCSVLNLLGDCEVHAPQAALNVAQAQAFLSCSALASDAFQMANFRTHEAPVVQTLRDAAGGCFDLQKGHVHQPVPPVIIPWTFGKNAVPVQKVVLLLSGGMDSALAAKRLLAQGHQVLGLHVKGLNMDAAAESQAASWVAAQLNIPLIIVDAHWSGLREALSTSGGRIFVSNRRNNSIPFGRDLILLWLGALAAKTAGAHAVAMAHEHEIWDRPSMARGGRLSSRTELSSRIGSVLMQDFLNAFFGDAKLSYRCPLAADTKYSLVAQTAQIGSEWTSHLSSCYWGSWCGQCPKCLTYGLLFTEHASLKHIPFETNPLGEYSQAVGNELMSSYQSHGFNSKPQPITLSQHAGPKALPLGGALREPLGMANLVVLSSLAQAGRLPKGSAFEQFRAQVLPTFAARHEAVREFLLTPQRV